MQSSPPSCLAKTNPQQKLVCSVASHLLIFRRQLSSVLDGEEKGKQDSLGPKGKGRVAGHNLGWTAGLTHVASTRPCGKTVVGDGCEVQFSLESPLAGPQPWIGQEIKAALENSFH